MDPRAVIADMLNESACGLCVFYSEIRDGSGRGLCSNPRLNVRGLNAEPVSSDWRKDGLILPRMFSCADWKLDERRLP